MQPRLAWLGLALALFGAGCGDLRDRDRFEPAVGELEILATYPAAGATDVDPLARIDVCLSAEVDPRALESFDALLHSGSLTFDGQQEVQLFSWRAPGSRTGLASERWCPGSVFGLTPSSPLQPGLGYRVELRPSALGWAGEVLDTTQAGWVFDPEDEELRWFLEFRVAGSASDPEPEEVPMLEGGPSLVELFGAGEVFDPERAACGCHQTVGELAWARLDLSDPGTAWSELLVRSGVGATGFPMVTPGRASESYLIQKLLRTDSGEGLHGIRGEAMPPTGVLGHGDLVRVAHWIQAGAVLE